MTLTPTTKRQRRARAVRLLCYLGGAIIGMALIAHGSNEHEPAVIVMGAYALALAVFGIAFHRGIR